MLGPGGQGWLERLAPPSGVAILVPADCVQGSDTQRGALCQFPRCQPLSLRSSENCGWTELGVAAGAGAGRWVALSAELCVPAPAQATTLHWRKSAGKDRVFSSQPWFPVAAVAVASIRDGVNGVIQHSGRSQGPLGWGRCPDRAEAGGPPGPYV